MTTAVIQIGNSDDKLPQWEWSAFTQDLRRLVARICEAIHFFGYSPPEAIWQNCCVVVVLPENLLPQLDSELSKLCRAYRQDSIALTVGDTQFVPPPTE